MQTDRLGPGKADVSPILVRETINHDLTDRSAGELQVLQACALE